MSKTYSLNQIIQMVLEENGSKGTISQEAETRQLRRAFYSLLEHIHADKDELKEGGKNLKFEEKELPFIKALLSQLYSRKGTAYKIISGKDTSFSSKDIMDLIQSIINEMDQTQISEEELLDTSLYYAQFFGYFYTYILEECHHIVDSFALNLQDLPFELKISCLKRFSMTLKHELVLRVIESALNTKDIAEILSLDNYEGEIPYNFCCPEVRESYVERDQKILKKIQQDQNLRTYIETSFGLKAEEIFSYLNNE